MKCNGCQIEIPAARLRAVPGTKTCVECSTVERNYVRTIISGKTTYSEWEVIKNKETKEYLEKLDSKGRQGFGSMLYRASRSQPMPKSSNTKLGTRVTRPQPEFSKETYDRVLKESMMWIDDDKDHAIGIIETAFKEEQISGIQRRHAIEILNVFKPDMKLETKEVEQEVIDEEIQHAFRNWKM